jgi:caffeoyl-CoA O-methyltransferase
MIMLDNILRLGRVIDPDDREAGTVVIRDLNDRIAADERVDRVLLPISDGVTLVRRRA